MSNNIENNLSAFKTIIDERSSWRKFTSQKINKEILTSLLDTVNYCPSSFGLEPWKVIVISDDQIKKELQQLCDNQPQVTSASHIFIVLSYKNEFFARNSSWMKKRVMNRYNLQTEEQYYNFYDHRFMRYMAQIKDWDQWAIRQAYIYLGTLWLSVTAHGLGASAMEGFDVQGIVPFLAKKNIITDEDKANFNASFILAVGYKDESYQPHPRVINNFDEIFTIVD